MAERYVWLEINSKTKDEPRHREIIFDGNGGSVRLKQSIERIGTENKLEYYAYILTASDCSLCSAYPIEWIPGIKLAMDRLQKFEEKSRPHWEKMVEKLEAENG